MAEGVRDDIRHVSVQGKKTSTRYTVPASWEPIKNLGSGAYATVAAFRGPGGEIFAVKKLERVLDHPILALRTLREVRLLAHFRHTNLLSIQDFFIEEANFKDVYLRLEMMDGDLHQLIYGSRLNNQQIQWVLYQTVRGLLCLKMAQVLHRDLKPGNILVKATGDVKIADLGLARTVDAEDDDQDKEVLTEYVVTRYYRAPEVVLTATQYTYAVDMWSVGCILGEMLQRKPLFQGKDSLDQIRQIVSVMGTQTDEEMSWLPRSSPSRKFVEKCNQKVDGEGFQRLLCAQDIDPAAADLLKKMLRFDPSRRLSVEQCLLHTYLAGFSPESDPEVSAARSVRPVDWSFDRGLLFESDGRAKPYDPEAFRRAFFDTRRIVAIANGMGGAGTPRGGGASTPRSAKARAGGMTTTPRASTSSAVQEPVAQKRWGRRWREQDSAAAAVGL